MVVASKYALWLMAGLSYGLGVSDIRNGLRITRLSHAESAWRYYDTSSSELQKWELHLALS